MALASDCFASRMRPSGSTARRGGKLSQDQVPSTSVSAPPDPGSLPRTYEGTYVILLVQDLDIRVVNTVTGELIRGLTLNPHIDYQPTGAPKGPTRKPRK